MTSFLKKLEQEEKKIQLIKQCWEVLKISPGSRFRLGINEKS